jgi:hypothetical protein
MVLLAKSGMTPFQPGLERLWSPQFMNLLGRGHVMLTILLYQVWPHEVRPFGAWQPWSSLGAREAPGSVWCGSLPSLVLF